MRILLAVTILLAACSGERTWKERQGTGYVVTSPFAARRVERPSVEIWEYGDGAQQSLQVQLVTLPPKRQPMAALVTMRDVLTENARVLREGEVEMGDVIGADVRFVKRVPDTGEIEGRARLVVQGTTLYSVVAHYPVGKPADADRFVESFRLTAASDPLARIRDAGFDIELGLGSADTTGWYTARSEGGKFTVSAPGPLNAADADLEAGARMYTLVTTAMPDRVKYVATCMTGSGKTPGSPDGFAASLPDATARRDRTSNGYPAVELDVGNASTMAVFVGTTRICMLVVEPYSASTKVPPAQIKRYFDSLKLD